MLCRSITNSIWCLCAAQHAAGAAATNHQTVFQRYFASAAVSQISMLAAWLTRVLACCLDTCSTEEHKCLRSSKEWAHQVLALLCVVYLQGLADMRKTPDVISPNMTSGAVVRPGLYQAAALSAVQLRSTCAAAYQAPTAATSAPKQSHHAAQMLQQMRQCHTRVASAAETHAAVHFHANALATGALVLAHFALRGS